jgi:beta-glucosidase
MLDRRQALAGLAVAAALPAGVRAKAFPRDFLWGVATAGHQIEGNSTASDYWLLEHLASTDFAEPSGDACDSWARWAEDIELVKGLGLNAYRFSVEWARIEPEEGRFSLAALDQYRRMCAMLRDQGILPIVTFHHFVSPRWLAARGGWESPDTPALFARYAERTARALGPLVGMACTLNEPNAQVNSWLLRGRTPGAKEAAMLAEARLKSGSDRFHSWFMGDGLKVRDVCLAVHLAGGDAIRGAIPGVKVGMTLALQDWVPGPGGEALYRALFAEARAPFYQAARRDEFLGVQPYMRFRTGPSGFLPARPGVPVNRDGQEAPPDVLPAVIREAWREAQVPICVTENGFDGDDPARIAHLTGTLSELSDLMGGPIPILGYVHWSLMDNWEWRTGYKARFGLYSVDRASFARIPKPSADAYRKLVATYRR